MKFEILTLAAAGSVIALGLAGIARAEPAVMTEPVTVAHSWHIQQGNLMREFSQGLGVDFGGATPAVVAKADSATAGASSDPSALAPDDRDRARSRERPETRHSR